MLSIILLLDHHKPDCSSGIKRKHKRCYFLCYELEKVNKEEIDFWTSRRERVKDMSLNPNLDPIESYYVRGLFTVCVELINYFAWFLWPGGLMLTVI